MLNNSHIYHQTTHDLKARGIDGASCFALLMCATTAAARAGGRRRYEQLREGDADLAFLRARSPAVADVKLNLPNMLKAKDKSVKALTGGVEFLLKKNKVDYIKGAASFASPTSIDVALIDGGNTQIETKNTIIATGSEVTPFPGIEIDEKQIVSSTGALDLQEVPKKMVVIGAGVIGLELGSVWSRLGAEVEVVEFLGAIGGAGMDGEGAKNFQKILGKQGLKFNLNTKVLGAQKKDGKVHLDVEGAKNGKKSTVRPSCSSPPSSSRRR